jgi:hypothetical protein
MSNYQTSDTSNGERHVRSDQGTVCGRRSHEGKSPQDTRRLFEAMPESRSPVNAERYAFTTDLDRFQKNCRLTLEIEGDKLPLSFDDAIEFKIEIAHLLVAESPSDREVRGTIDPWRVKFFPNGGGFSLEVRHPIRPVRTLALDIRQTEKFSEQIQKFIDAAGQLA